MERDNCRPDDRDPNDPDPVIAAGADRDAGGHGTEGRTYEMETLGGDSLLAMEKRLPDGCLALLYTDIGHITERERQPQALRATADESHTLQSPFLANVSPATAEERLVGKECVRQ